MAQQPIMGQGGYAPPGQSAQQQPMTATRPPAKQGMMSKVATAAGVAAAKALAGTPAGQVVTAVMREIAPPQPPPTCWCGCKDDPEMDPCCRTCAKIAVFPAALLAYIPGAMCWSALQAYYCCFSCCLMQHVTAIARGGVAQQRDTFSCWACQAKWWYKCNKCNGKCWLCSLPASKRVLRGHVVEAPCQVCLWGSTL